MTITTPTNVWSQHAQQWNRVGYPLRPSARDGELLLAAAEPALSTNGKATTVVILGVTREIVALPWPAHVKLLAVDQNAEMIAQVWQPALHLQSEAVRASWYGLPLQDRSVRLVVGDGAFTCLAGLSEVRRVLTELSRVLDEDGIVCIRGFFRPVEAESLDQVYGDTRARKIRGFHALKWRIAMALAQPPEYRVPVVDILEAFEALFPDRRVLAQMTDWPIETIETIEAYRDAEVCYNFPTLAAFQADCAPLFNVDQIAYAEGELAERCPTMRLRLLPRKK